MKVIFLDFDGVITIPETGWHISLPHVKRIKKICDKTGAKLVISSSWQRYAGTKNETREERVTNWLKGILMKDIKGPIKKFFEDYTYDMSGRFYGEFGNVRGSDIKSWLIRNPNVDNYVIIDDEGDMLDEQLYHFVQTNYEDGLTEVETKRAIKVLNKEFFHNSMALNFRLRYEYLKRCEGLENKCEELAKYNDLNKNYESKSLYITESTEVS